MSAAETPRFYSQDEMRELIEMGGTVSYWPTSPRRSKAYYRFDDALDTFEERAESMVVNVTHPLRKAARWIDDKFGGGK